MAKQFDPGTATIGKSVGINFAALNAELEVEQLSTVTPPATPGLDLGSQLSAILKLVNIPHKPEYHFALPERNWRFDIAFPDCKLAVECDGGLYIPGGGGHNSPEGFRKDLDKRNAAQLLGWAVLVVTGGMIQSGEALGLIEQALEARRK